MAGLQPHDIRRESRFSPNERRKVSARTAAVDDFLMRTALSARRAVLYRLGLVVALLQERRGNPVSAVGNPVGGGNREVLRFTWASLMPAELAWVVAELHRRGYRASTVNAIRAATLGVLRAAWRAGELPAARYAQLRDVPGVRCRRSAVVGRFVTAAEVARMFGSLAGDTTARGRLCAALLSLAVTTGARRFELVGLALEDLDLTWPAVTIRKGKGEIARALPLPPWVSPILRRWLAIRGRRPGPLLCRVSRRGWVSRKPLSGSGVYRSLRVLADRAGVARFRPHDLRKTLLTELLGRGLDVLAVATISGHADPRSLQPYDLRRQNAAQRAIEGLPDPTAGAWVASNGGRCNAA